MDRSNNVKFIIKNIGNLWIRAINVLQGTTDTIWLLDDRQSFNIVTVCNVLNMLLLSNDKVVDITYDRRGRAFNSLENLGINLTLGRSRMGRPSQIISQI